MTKRQTRGTDSGEYGRRSVARRPFLKGAGAVTAVGLTGLSGCLGGGGDDGFIYWNTINAQSQTAREFSEELIDEYESGAEMPVNVSWESLESGVIGAEWLTSFEQGNYPVMYDSEIRFDGQFLAGEWPEPVEEWQDKLDQDIVEQIEWLFPIIREQTSGLGEQVFEIPYGFILQAPFVGHMGHFEEAGLDPDEDFPPRDYEHLIEVATTLQEDGPADHGYQVYGVDGDASDTQLPHWAVAEGGADGLFLNDDWSDTHLDNDVWIEQTKNYVDIFQEHELSHPSTPTAGDEDVPAWMIADQVSMAQVDFFMYPEFAAQAPDMIEDGTIRFAPAWPGSEDQQAIILPYTLAITKPPESADADEWEEKQDAAIDFIEVWLSKENQRQLFEKFGVLPVRRDVWEDIERGPHNAIETAFTMANNADYSWSAHPQFLEIQYNTAAPYIQQALQGELTAEEACRQAASDIRDFL